VNILIFGHQVEQIGAIMTSTIRAASVFSLSVGIQFFVLVGMSTSAGLLAMTNLPSAVKIASVEPGTVLRDSTTYHPPDNGGPDSTEGSGSR
jgi:hypothetical protein